jgi:hypothetical protein
VRDGSKISSASSYFFVSGFIIGKIQYFPFPLVVSITNLLSLACYLMGYSLWFVSSHFNPEHPPLENEWYGFTQFKEQYLYAATLGIIATLMSACAIAFPVLAIPAAWLFVVSNATWTIGEYHKLQNPPDYDPNYSHSRQDTYLSYAITMTAIGLITATSVSLSFLFPAIIVPVVAVSAIICLGLGVLAADYWLDCTFNDHKPGIPENHSYTHMQQSFGPALNSQSQNAPVPHHGNKLFQTDDKHSEQPIIDVPASSIPPCVVP